MSQTPNLFDAAQLRQETGIGRAVAHSGPTWTEYATDYVRVYLTRHSELFCDDVWASGLTAPKSPRAFGAAMKAAIKNEWMVPTGRARRSHQSNNALRNVYRSRIYTASKLLDYPTFPEAQRLASEP